MLCTSAVKTLTVVLSLSSMQLIPVASKAKDLNLRAIYQESEQQNQTNFGYSANKKLTQCLAAERIFQTFDLFRASNGARVFGLDLRGNVWSLVAREGSCQLHTSHQLNKPEYSLDWAGARTWVTFYYEEEKLCRYTKTPHSNRIQRSCFEPIGIVNKYAPYFLN